MFVVSDWMDRSGQDKFPLNLTNGDLLQIKRTGPDMRRIAIRLSSSSQPTKSPDIRFKVAFERSLMSINMSNIQNYQDSKVQETAWNGTKILDWNISMTKGERGHKFQFVVKPTSSEIPMIVMNLPTWAEYTGYDEAYFGSQDHETTHYRITLGMYYITNICIY